MATSCYLADTSVFVYQSRNEQVHKRFEALLTEGRLAACHTTALEYLNNTPNAQGYEAIWEALHTMRWVEVTARAMDRALEIHRRLAATSQHRHFALPDLVIAATAELSGAAVLHYDADYDHIAAITRQPMEWVAERGSL